MNSLSLGPASAQLRGQEKQGPLNRDCENATGMPVSLAVSIVDHVTRWPRLDDHAVTHEHDTVGNTAGSTRHFLLRCDAGDLVHRRAKSRKVQRPCLECLFRKQ